MQNVVFIAVQFGYATFSRLMTVKKNLAKCVFARTEVNVTIK